MEKRGDYPRVRALMAISQTFYSHASPQVEAAAEAIFLRAIELGEVAAAAANGGRRGVEGVEEDRMQALARSQVICSYIEEMGKGENGSGLGGGVALHSPSPSAQSPSSASSNSKRLYLQVRVKSHSVWNNLQYWDSVVYEAVGAEVAKYNAAREEAKSTLQGRNAVAAAAEARQREVDVVFGQLGFFAFTMLSFGVEVSM